MANEKGAPRVGVITIATFSSLALLGLLFSSIGATLPVVRTAFGLGIGRAAQLSVVVQLGYAISVLLAVW